MIQPARRYIPEFSALELAEVSAAGVAAALDNLYSDPQRRQQLAQAAYQAALNPEYSWDTIADRFDDLFAELAQR
jgi:glycosyltransferase involved in cell wall biosynthesis